jgi:mRNA-degrading endonuclease RelE of RelBE toxin-antitoxin system
MKDLLLHLINFALLNALKSISVSTNLLKIKGSENKFRSKTGNKRVLLKWDKLQQILWVTSVAYRKDVYKKT